MSYAASAYMRTTAGTAVTRTGEVLWWPYSARPQPLTAYTRFVELGSIVDGSSRRILTIGLAATNPRIVISQISGSNYRITYVNAAGTSLTSTLATAPTLADLVELRATISAAGVVQIHQSINGAAETSATASSASALPAVWGGQRLYLGTEAVSQTGFAAFLNVAVMRGVQSRGTMRAKAGVK